MHRREFLLALAGLAVAPRALAKMAQADSWAMLSCGTDRQGQHFVSAINAQGTQLFQHALPGRGHGLSISPDQQRLAVFARRPGEYIHILDVRSGELRAEIRSNPERRFYGHGVFSQDGRWLYVTQNAFGSGDGKIAVYDCTDNYRLVEELPSYGIGPHQLVLLSDNRTLAVANGGIKTHPDLGRAKLNLDSMSPSLAYIDSRSSKLIEDYRLDKKYHQLSMRHLDANHKDEICIGMQYQGPVNQRPPLVVMHRGETELQLCHAPQDITRRMKNYCGSVMADASGDWFAISSPRGNLATLWRAGNGEFQESFEMPDVCGLAPDASGFIASNGEGKIARYTSGNDLQLLHQQAGFKWDNHMVLLPG
ncbi:MAG: DUF1513 domain-containing protein [Chromatiales bacterium]|jgi:hypothetical protein